MKLFPVTARHERIVSGVVIHPQNGRILTAIMGNEQNNQLAGERHIPGGPVLLNETPEVAIRHRLLDTLNVRVKQAHFFLATQRDAPLAAPNGQFTGRRYVTTEWFLVELDIQHGYQPEAIRALSGTILVPNSEKWVDLRDLSDNHSPSGLGPGAFARTPMAELTRIWPEIMAFIQP